MSAVLRLPTERSCPQTDRNQPHLHHGAPSGKLRLKLTVNIVNCYPVSSSFTCLCKDLDSLDVYAAGLSHKVAPPQVLMISTG